MMYVRAAANVAERKPSSQSSTVHPSTLATDGSLHRDLGAGFCSQTQTEQHTLAFWRVDLQKPFYVSVVDIYLPGNNTGNYC